MNATDPPPDLNADVFAIVAHYAGDRLFAIVLGYAPVAPENDGAIVISNRQQRGAPKPLTWDEFSALVLNAHWDYTSRDVCDLFLPFRAALQTLAAASAVCRQWNQFMDAHWTALYLQIKKFIPFVYGATKDRVQRAAFMVPQNPLVPPDDYRLALKLACKNGKKLANQTIKTKKVILNRVTRRGLSGLKPRVLYIVRNNATNTRALKQGSTVLSTLETIECKVVEKSEKGARRWANATLAQVDAALSRRARILNDTRTLMKSLKKYS